jgi:phosphatidate cytidylyltransferase
MADLSPPPPSSKALVFARRTTSTLVLWGLVAATFISMQAWAFLALLGILTILSTLEYFRMLRAAEIRCFPRFGMLLALAYTAALYWHFLGGAHAAPPALDTLALFLAVTGPFTLQLRHPIRGLAPLIAVAASLLGFVYIAFLFSFAARLLFMMPAAGMETGAFLLLWLLAVTKFTDMGAYLTGSLIGRRKMIPHVSPGKTWEGTAGGLAFALLAACGLYAAFPERLSPLTHWGHVIALGFIIAILAVIGDLAESIVKRSVNAKDSGRMLPGIGGALDLIDSICFTAPALYFYLKWILPAAP